MEKYNNLVLSVTVIAGGILIILFILNLVLINRVGNLESKLLSIEQKQSLLWQIKSENPEMAKTGNNSALDRW